MMSEFQKLGVSKWLSESLHAMKINAPTAIQKACIPKILAGELHQFVLKELVLTLFRS